MKTIIVTMNLRSFGASWIHSELEAKISNISLLASDKPPLLKRFFLSFPPPMPKTKEESQKVVKQHWKKDALKFPYSFPYKNVLEWDKALFNGYYHNPDGSCDLQKCGLAAH